MQIDTYSGPGGISENRRFLCCVNATEESPLQFGSRRTNLYNERMKLAVQIQLLPDAATDAKLRAVMERFNAACNWVAGECFARQEASVFEARKFAYHEIRERFGLSSQMTQLAIKAVCDVYKRDRSIRPEFREDAAIPYDARTMGFKGIDKVSLLTLDGRVFVPFILGSYQADRMAFPRGQCKLVLRKDGKWFLLVTVDVPDGTPTPVTDFIGVDIGVKNLATTDDGENFSGEDVEKTRRKYQQKRKTCQRTGTKSARRKLHKNRKKEANFRRDQNHKIAKRIVDKAKGTGCGIACEDLAGIGGRTTAKKAQRNRMKGWAFFQLRSFITYKAALAGVTVVPVDPRNTSRTCSECGHCEKANRKSRDEFECRHCGFKLPADWNAARNIRDRAVVKRPIVGTVDGGGRIPTEVTYKPPALAGGT